MKNKYTVKEFAKAISLLEPIQAIVVCDVLSGKVTAITIAYIKLMETLSMKQSDLNRAIANWDLELFPAHEDDVILTLLEELLEDVLCTQQPGKIKEEAQ